MRKLRITKSVQSILDALSYSNQAISGAQLVKRFQEDMNKTTVYRILERLENEGIVHSFSGIAGLKWFAMSENTQHNHSKNHSHFQCNVCGMSKCLSLDIDIPDLPAYKIEATNLILVGQCEDCIP